jgi:hypothetical protein
MLLSTIAETNWNAVRLPIASSDNWQVKRIMAALGIISGGLPKVSEEALAKYHSYLSKKLVLPFTAYYPLPTSAQEHSEFRCAVDELLDPTEHLGDEFDGIFCKTCKGKFEVNLPLIELHVPEGSPNYQLVEDYWYWFWNWR